MEIDKDMFKFYNEFIFLDHLEVGVIVNVNVVRKCFVNRFHETVPPKRILTTLLLIDNVILRLHDKNLEGIQDGMHSVRENVLYMLSFEKFVEEKPVGDDNDVDKNE